MNKNLLIVLLCAFGMQSVGAAHKVIRVDDSTKESTKSVKRVAKPKKIKAKKVKVASVKESKVEKSEKVKVASVKKPKVEKSEKVKVASVKKAKVVSEKKPKVEKAKKAKKVKDKPVKSNKEKPVGHKVAQMREMRLEKRDILTPSKKEIEHVQVIDDHLKEMNQKASKAPKVAKAPKIVKAPKVAKVRSGKRGRVTAKGEEQVQKAAESKAVQSVKKVKEKVKEPVAPKALRPGRFSN